MPKAYRGITKATQSNLPKQSLKYESSFGPKPKGSKVTGKRVGK